VRLTRIRQTAVQIVASVGDGTEDEGMPRQGSHSVRRCSTQDETGMVRMNGGGKVFNKVVRNRVFRGSSPDRFLGGVLDGFVLKESEWTL
jgi:hypothetical protein